MSEGIDYLELAAFENLRHVFKLKQVNAELLEQLASSLRWLIHYSAKYNIPLPEKEKIIDLVNKAIAIENKLPTQNEQPDRNNRQWNITIKVVATRFQVIY